MGTQIGLDMLHYVLLEDDEEENIAYGTPERIIGAIQANINPNSSLESLFADDGPSEVASTLGQVELEMIAKDVPLAQRAILLGQSRTGAITIGKATDTPPWVAIGFRSLKSNGSYRYTWLVKGKFRQPEQKNETKGETINFQPPTLIGNFVKRDGDQEWIRQVDEDDEDYADEGATWFDSPLADVDSVAPTLSSSDPTDAEGEVSVDIAVAFTFDEAIKVSTIIGANFLLMKADGTPVTCDLTYNSLRTVITLTPGSALTAGTAYIAIATTAVKDTAGNSLAAPVVINFTTAS